MLPKLPEKPLIWDGLKGRRFFVCDHDPLYTKEFRQILTDSEVEVIQTRVGCPQQNGYAESFVSAIKRECIDHMIFFSETSLRRAVGQYVEHYHQERNHQGLDNLIPFPNIPQNHSESGPIVKSERLGGLLNYYHREEQEVGEAA
ncbi:integrase core domain-containing protein [Coraliomargarita algicola]|uniref:Integrase core domain-containing protein n=1 Tax=Coraliomargarita algicola TaxID=3092156 RepID=A0ABZ0RQA1_9BACT|nr:integrase core domain-containing protein [Coraliomargarita sp. J2-16]WPJ97296.1 integrase core domain-containing protein [Coraliomargarita sp. J2-16]